MHHNLCNTEAFFRFVISAFPVTCGQYRLSAKGDILSDDSVINMNLYVNSLPNGSVLLTKFIHVFFPSDKKGF